MEIDGRLVKVLRENAREVVFEVEEIGHVSAVFIEPRTSNNPSPLPWHLVNVGTTHATPQAALAAFLKGWDTSGADPEASYWGRRNADSIDGYDRDDLGPSEDF